MNFYCSFKVLGRNMDFKFATFLINSAQICTSLALAPCVCTKNRRPVCGSDGKTYSNICLLDCAAYTSKTEITVAKQGPCDSPTNANNDCICNLDYRPVCGTDGKTYGNECALECQMKRFNPSLSVRKAGACDTPQEPACLCPYNYQPVCGSDGNTYSNDCDLNCATKKNSSLRVASSGPCVDKVKVAESPLQY